MSLNAPCQKRATLLHYQNFELHVAFQVRDPDHGPCSHSQWVRTKLERLSDQWQGASIKTRRKLINISNLRHGVFCNKVLSMEGAWKAAYKRTVFAELFSNGEFNGH
jgi:hypothetical protein